MRRPPILALLLLVGCRHPGPTLKAAAPADVPSGWTAAFDRESGVSLALPPGWRVGVAHALSTADLMPGGGGADLGAVGGPASEMGAELERQDAAREKAELARLREKGIVLHCTDGSKPVPAEEPTSIAVKREKDANDATLDDAAVAEQQDEHRAMTKTVVDLPVGKAVRLVAQGQNRIGDQECHVSYVFLDGSDAYALRFASTNAPGAILGVEKAVAQTFRVAKAK